MHNYKELSVCPIEAQRICDFVHRPPAGMAEKGDICFEDSVTFDDGCQMKVEVLGSLDGRKDLWCRLTLLSSEGALLASEYSEYFLGEHELEDYCCEVRALSTWCVVYRDKGANPLSAEVFKCEAEDYDHAEEQCENAYPDADILWLVETDNPQDAVDNWLTAGEKE